MASNEEKTQPGSDGEAKAVEKPKSNSKKTVSVRFTDPNIDRREISKADFERNGVKVDSDYVWDRENDFTVNASPEAAEFLGTLSEFEVAGS